MLLKLWVPEAAIGTFGQANRNTFDEAVALREWADEHHVSRIIPTEIVAASVRLEIQSFEPPGHTRAEWWKTEAGMIAFQNEIMKYLHYRLKY